MKKLLTILFASTIASIAQADCPIQVGLTSNVGKEFELTKRILEEKGYSMTDKAPLVLFFSASAEEYNSYYKIMLHKTDVTISRYENNEPVVVYEGRGVEMGTRLNKNPWRKSVKEALATLPKCNQE